MIEVAMNQDKTKRQDKSGNIIYIIPQRKSSLFQKKNQIFSWGSPEFGGNLKNVQTIQSIRGFSEKFSDYEKMKPLPLDGQKRYITGYKAYGKGGSNAN